MPTNKRSALELKYLYGGVSHYRASETLVPRRIPDYELFFMLEGTATYSANGQKYVATPGTLILPKPGFRETFRWAPYPRARLAYLHFDILRTPSDWPDAKGWPVLVYDPPTVVGPLMQCLIRQLSTVPPRSLAAPNQHMTRLLEALLGEVLLDTAPLSAATKPDFARPEPVERAIHRMRQVFNQQPPKALTLSELALAAGVTPQHLSRLFRSSLDVAPMSMLGLMRLQLALALLSHTTLPVGAIAERCGFESPFYFSRRFTSCFGKPPTVVRKALHNGKPAPKMPLPLDVLPRVYW
ncbi:MAG TPA: AraC family transcriptional regulator [Kiritimatiellia bacterium]|nr:AraC family transcriptional regulator [Kiritimatiellia bacterium]HRU70616.1 AraC family transcriptional regulator [Kiritimatiellia bacterium]